MVSYSFDFIDRNNINIDRGINIILPIEPGGVDRVSIGFKYPKMILTEYSVKINIYINGITEKDISNIYDVLPAKLRDFGVIAED